jgi:chemotaxis protein methyltransferase WspC
LPRRRPTAPPPPIAPPQDLDAAQRLADQGHLVDAAKCCEAHLRAHGPSPRGLYLLGLIRDASGDQAGAIEAYRKALYLDPIHHEVLVHLALLLERGNDAAGARVMQDRIRRLAQRDPS